ncbi:MAG: AAA family ATPase [Granulosicoccus sp.]
MFVVMAGLPASGKSVVASGMQRELDAVILDKDQFRVSLFADYVDYTREQDDLCVRVIYDVACYHLSRRPDKPVILDGRTYSRGYQIAAVKQAAARAAVKVCFIECVCSAESARQRLESDRSKHPAKDRDFALYQRSLSRAEPITEPRLTLDTDKAGEAECVQLALRYIRRQQVC